MRPASRSSRCGVRTAAGNWTKTGVHRCPDLAKLLDQPSERPADFDLAAYWKSSTAQFQERPRYNATLRLEPRTAEGMKTWGIVSDVQAEKDTDPEGWITLRAQFDDEEQACFIVLGLGPRVDAIEPAKLRERVAADIAAMIARKNEILY